MFFQLSTVVLAIVLFTVIGGAAAAGLWIGGSMRQEAGSAREPLRVMQGPA